MPGPVDLGGAADEPHVDAEHRGVAPELLPHAERADDQEDGVQLGRVDSEAGRRRRHGLRSEELLVRGHGHGRAPLTAVSTSYIQSA
jgi:hypothetical protein